MKKRNIIIISVIVGIILFTLIVLLALNLYVNLHDNDISSLIKDDINRKQQEYQKEEKQAKKNTLDDYLGWWQDKSGHSQFYYIREKDNNILFEYYIKIEEFFYYPEYDSVLEGSEHEGYSSLHYNRIEGEKGSIYGKFVQDGDSDLSYTIKKDETGVTVIDDDTIEEHENKTSNFYLYDKDYKDYCERLIFTKKYSSKSAKIIDGKLEIEGGAVFAYKDNILSLEKSNTKYEKVEMNDSTKD